MHSITQQGPRNSTSLAALCLATALSACSESTPVAPVDFEGPRHVILISLDTLRADACSLYGYEKQTTPFLDRLAEERGIVFNKHMVNSNNTLTSHATMLTGLLMMTHSAEDKGPGKRIPLAPEYQSVAESFQSAGFETAAFLNHPIWLSEGFGINQGFDEFKSDWFGAEKTNNEFLGWVDSNKPRRMFAFLHYYDAHSELEGTMPYDAPQEYLERFAPERPSDFTGTVKDEAGNQHAASTFMNYYTTPDRSLPADHLEYIRGGYDAGVAKLDADIEDLFAELEERGILDDSLIVITSDHGEEFEEHGGTLHNQYFDEIMNVPLMILPAKNLGAERKQLRVDQPSRCVDIAATLLDYAALPPLDPTQGKSLRPMAEGTQEEEYRDTFFGKIIVRGQDKMSEFKVVNLPKEAGRFFDLAEDPAELNNLVVDPSYRQEFGGRMLEARARVQQFRRECDLVKIAIGAKAGTAPKPNAKQLRELEALGYVEAGAGSDKEP